MEKTYTLIVIADENRTGDESLRDEDDIPFKSEKGQEYKAVGTNMDFSNATRQGETLIVKLSVRNQSLAEKSNGVNLPQDLFRYRRHHRPQGRNSSYSQTVRHKIVHYVEGKWNPAKKGANRNPGSALIPSNKSQSQT